MRWNGFGRSIAFAALAAAAWPAFALVLAPIVGGRAAATCYGVAIAALYVFGIAPSRGRGVVAAVTATAIALLFAALGREPGAAALGAATAIGVARSGVLYRSRGARAVALEVALLGGGLVLARWLGAPGLVGTALALWSFFLVQSAFFLVGGIRVAVPHPAGGDRFDAARRRALALLEEA